jgi:hypothetical protein
LKNISVQIYCRFTAICCKIMNNIKQLFHHFYVAVIYWEFYIYKNVIE